MKIRVIAVGKIKDRNIQNLIEHYSESIRHDAKLETIEVKDSSPEEEGKKIVELLERSKENKFVFVLIEEGRQLSSIELSGKIRLHAMENKTLFFIIGRPFGLSVELKERADMHLSLSKMTFTHEMARLFLMEQIYRAISILKNKKYHKN